MPWKFVTPQNSNPFGHSIYTVRARIWISEGCEILDSSGNRILGANLLGFFGTVKIRVCAGKSGWSKILKVEGPKEFGPMSAAHDYPVFDAGSDSRMGTVRLTNDGWILLDEGRHEIGRLKRVPELEDKDKPKVWDAYNDDVHLCRIVQFASGKIFGNRVKISVDCSSDTENKLDRRLLLSSALVQAASEIKNFHDRISF
jgi:hypothetical protein